jgi:cytochrome b561
LAEGGVERQRYSSLQRISHWTIGLLCVVEFPTARGIQRAHLGHAFGIKPPLLDAVFATAHQWAGWAILALTALLIASRMRSGTPALPSGMQAWQRWLAHATHTAIYLGLFALVGSGAAMYLDGRYAFLHAPLARIGVGLIALHIAAAAWHQLIRRDDILDRMLPGRDAEAGERPGVRTGR